MRHHSKLTLSILLSLVLFLACYAPAWGHPHGFVEAYVILVFDQDGFAGVKERWVLDEMTTLAVYEVINENGDHKLDDKEVEAVRQESFVGLDEYGFFTAIRIAGEPFDVKWATDFNASLENGKLVYDFFVPCHVKAASAPKEIKVAVFDPTFFVYVAYASESTKHFDPSKDPLFTDSSAPADPGDFQRFMAATGLGGFSGEVQLDGAYEKFNVRAKVADAPDMAYFYDQIIPAAFTVQFNK